VNIKFNFSESYGAEVMKMAPRWVQLYD